MSSITTRSHRSALINTTLSKGSFQQPENDDEQCIFCCQIIYRRSALPQQMLPEIVESIPALLKFRPSTDDTWKDKCPPSVLCPSCCKMAAEGHQLLLLLAETQSNIDQISDRIKTLIYKSCDASVSESTEADGAKLREDLLNSLLLKLELQVVLPNGEIEYPKISVENSPAGVCDDDDTMDTGVDNEQDQESSSSWQVSADDRARTMSRKVASVKFGPKELSLLLKLKDEREAELKQAELFRRRIIWDEIASQISNTFGVTFTSEQCRRKIKNYTQFIKQKARRQQGAEADPLENGEEDERIAADRFNETSSRVVPSDPLPESSNTKSKTFTEAEVSVLLAQCELNLKDLGTSNRTRNEAWDRIALEVSAISGLSRTPQQCRNKVKNLKKDLKQRVLEQRALDDLAAAKTPRDDAGSTTGIDDDEGNAGIEDENAGNIAQNEGIDAFSEAVLVSVERLFPDAHAQMLAGDETVTIPFTPAESAALRAEYARNADQLKVTSPMGRTAIWEEIARTVSSVSNIVRTEEQCRRRIKNLNYVARQRRNKREKDSSESEEEGLNVHGEEELGGRANQNACNNLAGKSGKGPPFTAKELSVLLSSQAKHRRRLSSTYLSTRQETWAKIARAVSSASNIRRTVQQCRTKLKNYKKYCAQRKKEGLTTTYEGLVSEPELGLDVDAADNDNGIESDPETLFEHFTVCLPNGNFLLKEANLKLPRCDAPTVRPRSKRRVPGRVHELQTLIKRHRRHGPLRRKYGGASLQRYPCPQCPRVFTLPNMLQRHIDGGHDRKVRRPPKIPCVVPDCPTKFKSFGALERHVPDVHGGKLEHFCPAEGCGRGFYTSSALELHSQNHHAARNFHCESCPATFRTAAILACHMTNRHRPPKKPFICDICSADFKLPVLLRDHQAKVHGQHRERYTCPKCGVFFAAVGYVKRHLKMHHPEEGKPAVVRYACTVPHCGARFYTPTQLKLHERGKHSSERNFQCERCAKTFKHKGQLDEHIRRHDGFKYTCHYCQRDLANQKTLKMHIDLLHEPKVRIRCEDCGEGFLIRKYYHRHRPVCPKVHTAGQSGVEPARMDQSEEAISYLHQNSMG